MRNASAYASLLAELRRCRQLAAAMHEEIVGYFIDLAIMEAKRNAAARRSAEPRDTAPEDPKRG